MKKLVFLSVVLLWTTLSEAQEWFPVGASWHYNQVNWLHNREEFRYFEVVGDTTIQGLDCAVVEGICDCGVYGSVNYLHTQGDRVFRYDTDADTFHILYDFTLESGDTLKHFDADFGNTQHVVDSVTKQGIGNMQVRVQHLSWVKGGAFEFGQRIYEYLGSHFCLYPQIGVCDPQTGNIRCYEDELFGLVNFMDPGEECDQIISSLHEVTPASIRISPNPASTHVSIVSDTRLLGVECIEIGSGKVVRRQDAFGNSIEFQLAGFSTGIYLLRLLHDDGIQEVRRIVVH